MVKTNIGSEMGVVKIDHVFWVRSEKIDHVFWVRRLITFLSEKIDHTFFEWDDWSRFLSELPIGVCLSGLVIKSINEPVISLGYSCEKTQKHFYSDVYLRSHKNGCDVEQKQNKYKYICFFPITCFSCAYIFSDVIYERNIMWQTENKKYL